ncbi:LAFA_0E15918g1_1 [Lachancea sp. 'fantastica']|nr:LAFA_0E15918g1_1 [Lachancea sp. 'fantastica']
MRSKLLSSSRISSLYSDFRNLKELNPEGYEANIRNWRQVLLEEVLEDEVIVKTGPELLEELSDPQAGQPRSLDVVLDFMIAEGSLVPLEKFKSRVKESIVSTVLGWTLNTLLPNSQHAGKTRISSTKGHSYLRRGQYAVLPTIKKKYDPLHLAVLERICKKAVRYSDLIFTKTSFCQKVGFADHLKDWAAFETMLTYMDHYKGIIVTDSTTVKVRGFEVSGITAKFESSSINIDDQKIASVKEAQVNLKTQTSHLEDRIKDSKQQLRVDIKSQKPKALLRTRLQIQKLLEKNLNLAFQNLNNVEILLLDIEAAIDRVQLKHVFEQSRDVLTSLSSQLGSLNDLEKLVEDINTEKLKGEDIDRVFEAEMDDGSDEEIEEELQKMDAEMKLEEQVLQKLSSLELSSHEPPQEAEKNDKATLAEHSQSPTESKEHAHEKQPLLI